MTSKPAIAVLDDYQGVALEFADWSPVLTRASVDVFRDHLIDADAVVERLAPYEVVCVMRERTPLPRAVIERLPRLKLIASTGPRNASIDTAAAKERGIAGKTLGIIGLGNVGAQVARIGLAVGMQVVAWSQNLTAQSAAVAGARLVSKEELLRLSDVISIHLVLSARTRGLIGAAEFALMKPSARLVNTSHGPIIVEAALIEALTEHRIAGAAVDVFDTEPLPPQHPYRQIQNLLATPHIGFVSRGLYERFHRDTVANIVAWPDGVR